MLSGRNFMVSITVMEA